MTPFECLWNFACALVSCTSFISCRCRGASCQILTFGWWQELCSNTIRAMYARDSSSVIQNSLVVAPMSLLLGACFQLHLCVCDHRYLAFIASAVIVMLLMMIHRYIFRLILSNHAWLYSSPLTPLTWKVKLWIWIVRRIRGKKPLL